MKSTFNSRISGWGVFFLVLFTITQADGADRVLRFEPGDRIVFLGGTLAERTQYSGNIECQLQLAFPNQKLTVRNMGWSGDEVGLMPRPLNFGSLEQGLEEAKADVVFMFFGANESFKGQKGIADFISEYEALITQVATITPKIVLFSPIAHEKLPTPWPDPAIHNRHLEMYTIAIHQLADRLELPFVDLFHPTRTLMSENYQSRLTNNGIHLTESGYQILASIIAAEMNWPSGSKGTDEALRKLIVEKNRQYFLRWRPVNGEYIFGRRNQPFGILTYPPEMMKLDTQISDLDRKIHEIFSSD